MDLSMSRRVAAPPEQVWRAWSDPDHLRRWWGPDGFTVPVAEVDLTVGGHTLVGMRAPETMGGMTFYTTWTFTAVEPHRSIEYLVHFCDADGNRLRPADLGLPAGIPDDGVPHEVTFVPAGDGTELTLTERGYTTAEARDSSALGLAQVLDKLVALYATG